MSRIVLALGLVATLLLGGCSGSSSLTSGTWQWTASTTTVPASQSVVPDPQNYTIAFKSDGTAAIKADCNNVAATYTTSGSNLTITMGPSTLAACPDTSLAPLYVAALPMVATYAITSGQLVMTLASNAGTMTFKGS